MQRIATLESKSRFHDVKFVQLEQECMVVACEDGKGRLFVEQAGEVVCVAELIGHSNRSVQSRGVAVDVFARCANKGLFFD